jgi:hypothetical protein
VFPPLGSRLAFILGIAAHERFFLPPGQTWILVRCRELDAKCGLMLCLGLLMGLSLGFWDTLQYPASRHLLVPARCSWFNSAHACVLTCVLALCGSEIDIYEYLAEKHGFD